MTLAPDCEWPEPASMRLADLAEALRKAATDRVKNALGGIGSRPDRARLKPC
jgi:hypothetical protein